MPPSLLPVLAVAAGGAAGAVLRVLVAEALPHEPGAWPWSTLLVNAAGAFALGLLLTVLPRRPGAPPWLQPLLGPGLLGGFTTFSTLSLDAVQLADAGRSGLAVAYAGSSVLAVLGAVLLARRVAR